MSDPPGTVLRSFLDDSRRPAGTLSYHELQGFLFTVACAPEPVTASAWMPVVFGGHEPEYESLEEAHAVLGELMALYNLLNAEVVEDRATLPADCRFRADPLANFELDAPLAQWSRGFVKGHSWLEESWREHFPPGAYESLKAILITLQFFAYPQTDVEAVFGELAPVSLPVMAATTVDIFPEAIRNYSYFGRRLQQVAAAGKARKAPHAHGTKVGRNEPCPCGSGRKYKKCCGAAA